LGMNVYHKNRLIMPFWKVLQEGSSRGRSVVGVLEANFIEPAHDWQDFERTPLFIRLEMKLRQIIIDFWKEKCHLIGYQPTDPHLRSQYKANLKDSGGPGAQVRHKTSSARRTGGLSSNLLPGSHLHRSAQAQENGMESEGLNEVNMLKKLSVNELRQILKKFKKDTTGLKMVLARRVCEEIGLDQLSVNNLRSLCNKCGVEMENGTKDELLSKLKNPKKDLAALVEKGRRETRLTSGQGRESDIEQQSFEQTSSTNGDPDTGQQLNIQQRRRRTYPGLDTGEVSDVGSMATLSLSGAEDKHKDQVAMLCEQIDNVQKKLLEKEALRSTESSVNEMNAANTTIDELRLIVEKDALLRSLTLQLHDAKLFAADKQACLEKLKWEINTANKKVEDLQRDMSDMEFERSSLMTFFETISESVSGDSYDDSTVLSSYELEALLSKSEIDKIEQERVKYAEALAAARENPNLENLHLAAKARSRLRVLVV